jgi:putative transposase
MARKRFKPEQIVAILREAERGVPKEELYKKHGIAEQTFYRWRKVYGGMGVSEIKRIKELEEENRKLRELAGNQALVIESMKEYQKKRGWL